MWGPSSQRVVIVHILRGPSVRSNGSAKDQGALTPQELEVPRMSTPSLLCPQVLLPNARDVEQLGVLLLRRRDLHPTVSPTPPPNTVCIPPSSPPAHSTAQSSPAETALLSPPQALQRPHQLSSRPHPKTHPRKAGSRQSRSLREKAAS